MKEAKDKAKDLLGILDATQFTSTRVGMWPNDM